ncbi:PSP1-domain-containing protein [Backusella circina FSU 941]|nr:PSP1-domain-containing protein [Backusella circina FSU 941]
MSRNNSSALLDEEKDTGSGWQPFSRRGSALPHPFDLEPFRNQSQDYAFPPIRRNSAISTADKFSTPSWNTPLFGPQDYPDIASVPMLPEVSVEPLYREQRSMSYSFGNDDFWQFNTNNQQFTSPLDTMEEEDDEEDDVLLLRERSRSKSSAAVLDIWHPSSTSMTPHHPLGWMPTERRRSLAQTLPLHHPPVAPSLPPPTQSPLLPPPSPLPHPSSSATTTATGNASMFSQMSAGDRERLGSIRRFSLAPTPNDNHSFSLLNQRRHSLAGPTHHSNIDRIAEDLESLAIREKSSHNLSSSCIMGDLQDEGFMLKTEEMGKGTRLDAVLDSALFYVVEFKGGRSDVFYSQPGPKRGELVIVEADRGRDLGKVVLENITRPHLDYYYYQLNSNSSGNEDESIVNNGKKRDIYIKCIYRLAQPEEINLLLAKNHDEQKALLICQTKIKQKKLNMQVVDAEYQWDRRKLTFYFIAERRVDFRELVRELFKLYKTRIWMCAVSSIKSLQIDH